MKRIVSKIVLALLLLGMVTLAFNIQPVKSDWNWTGTIYIRADGSIEPSDAPISTVDNVTYMLTDNIIGYVPWFTNAIVVQKDNIVIDGAGHTVQETAPHIAGYDDGTIGIYLSKRSNVTIKNIAITKFFDAIYLSESSGNSIVGNNITANIWKGIDLHYNSNYNSIIGNNINNKNNITNYGTLGIYLCDSCSNNIVSGNNIANNYYGICLASYSNNNCIVENNMTVEVSVGIFLDYSSNNEVSGNNVANNIWGIRLFSSSKNSIVGNNITASSWRGMDLFYSSDSKVYHNNFINNLCQVYTPAFDDPAYDSGPNVWDDGYPSGGNYWSDYEERYPSAKEIDESGLGDTPYIIRDADNVDHYPLVNPYTPTPYTLTITTTVGGTTNPPSLGTYIYTARSLVQIRAIPEANYLFDHWELDSVNVGSANPYSALMDKNHTLKAFFLPIPKPPVGGYSFATEEYIPIQSLTPYLALIAILAIGFTTIRRKTTRKTK